MQKTTPTMLLRMQKTTPTMLPRLNLMIQSHRQLFQTSPTMPAVYMTVSITHGCRVDADLPCYPSRLPTRHMPQKNVPDYYFKLH